MTRCEFCAGDGEVTLYRHSVPKIRPEPDQSIAEVVVVDRKRFPCPACQPYVPVLQLQAIDFIDQHRISQQYIDQARDHVHRYNACEIGDEMRKIGAIRFTEKPLKSSPYDPMIEVHARTYVVMPDHPAIVSMEQRVRNEALQIADRIINEAMQRIRHWGSHYHAFNVPKDVVGQTLREEYRKHSEGVK